MDNKHLGNYKHSDYREEIIKFADKSYKEGNLLPKRYVFVLTNLCNLACNYCFQVRKKLPGAMTTQDWINVVDQLPDYARVAFTGGEPLSFKGFREVFHKVASKFECNMICNGLLLKEDTIDFLLSYEKFKVLGVSIDSVKNIVRKIANKNPSTWNDEWNRTEKMFKYFNKKKKEINSNCTLDAKTVILDEYAHELFDIHRYCIEDLGFETHVFTFQKGSPLQMADFMFKFDKIYEKNTAYIYKNFGIIKEQLNLIKEYNIKNNIRSYLNPKGANLNDGDLIKNEIDLFNNVNFNKLDFKSCKSPWTSLHINANGKIFPCLAIDMGNIKEKSLKELFFGEKYNKFKDTIRNNGLVDACNRCEYLVKK
tara:strand:- start:2282 stop:3382 length:1101 start_codon:yes stop_codon:yes gene_type:complete